MSNEKPASGEPQDQGGEACAPPKSDADDSGQTPQKQRRVLDYEDRMLRPDRYRTK